MAPRNLVDKIEALTLANPNFPKRFYHNHVVKEQRSRLTTRKLALAPERTQNSLLSRPHIYVLALYPCLILPRVLLQTAKKAANPSPPGANYSLPTFFVWRHGKGVHSRPAAPKPLQARACVEKPDPFVHVGHRRPSDCQRFHRIIFCRHC
ncbi:hypothetical protein HPB50_024434 [Hyalomma asiaticum]|uniref:Uncharacterized protein n=1 Tax=Hyalomma asiaticum TaxID=266040 RepID=A0ACB7SUY8_HYAAI|nr:hypothetical protein HPB50_024434 [Hyalomma asiaticum]